jgi:hypothetical protein
MPGVFTGSHAEHDPGDGITMTPPPQLYTNDQIARMLEMSCKYPDIENNCAGCEYSPTSGMRKGCCDFGNDDIVRILRSRPNQSEWDKVLDDLVKFLIIEYDDAAGFDDMKRMGILLMIINKMSQLRQQAGEP